MNTKLAKKQRAKKKLAKKMDLEIALSGFPAKVQHHELLQPGRRCVETSGDVIGLAFTSPATICRALFYARGRVRPLVF